MSNHPAAGFRIVSEITEEGKNYPAVIHTFYGVTLAEARRYLQAHMATDTFFKSCVEKKSFGNFTCKEKRRSERWNGAAWCKI